MLPGLKFEHIDKILKRLDRLESDHEALAWRVIFLENDNRRLREELYGDGK